jgi:hypothetical protein
MTEADEDKKARLQAAKDNEVQLEKTLKSLKR